MKRLFSYLLLLAAITAACSDNTDEIYTPGDDIEGSNDRYLVVYCSRTGNTAEMAQTIQSALACDMITVNPETPYDENYNAMLERADYVGCVSGAKVDKSQVFTYHLGEAGTPVIDESPLVMECEVVDNYETEDFDNFICKIANTYVEENILNDKGKPDYNKLKPVLFEMPNYTYLRTGEEITKCMGVGKEYGQKIKQQQ